MTDKLTIDDQQIKTGISMILSTGVRVSALITAVGALLYLAGAATAAVDYSKYSPNSTPYTDFQNILNGLKMGDSAAIIQLGIVVLLLTPLMRVIYCCFEFSKRQDWQYSIMTALVLAVLTYSLMQ